MVKRPTDLVPKMLVDECLRVARIDRDWVEWRHVGTLANGRGEYTVRIKINTWLRRLGQTGADVFGLWALSAWLVDGPKIFRPTPEQCAVLEQVEVRLTLADYAQPYPAILIDLPPGAYDPFHCVLVFSAPDICIASLHTKDHRDDITTTIPSDDTTIETSINRFDEDCRSHADTAAKALRIAINACLALVSYGYHADYLFPAEVASDTRLAEEDSERGRRALGRLQTQPQLVHLDHTVVLHRTRTATATGGGAGGEKSFHWRRGHWHMVPCGVGRCQRKRVLYPPTMIRADKLQGDASDTTTTYQ